MASTEHICLLLQFITTGVLFIPLSGNFQKKKKERISDIFYKKIRPFKEESRDWTIFKFLFIDSFWSCFVHALIKQNDSILENIITGAVSSLCRMCSASDQRKNEYLVFYIIKEALKTDNANCGIRNVPK